MSHTQISLQDYENAMTMFRDCMNILDEVRSLGLKSPQGKLSSSSKKNSKRNVDDTPITTSKRRKR